MSTNYFTRPELGKDADSYTQRLTQIQTAAEQTKAAVEEKDRTLSRLNNVMQLLQIRAKRGDSTAAEKYNSMIGQYRIAYLERAKAANAHNKNVSAWDEAYTAFEAYANNQTELENHWRSTIRDSATVKADLDAIGTQIEAQREADRVASLEKYKQQQADKPWYEKVAGYLSGVQDTTLPTYSAPAGSSQPATSKELQTLLDQQKLLQEEYDWSRHYYYDDMQKAADFGDKSKYVSTYRGGEQFNAMAGVYTDSGFDDIAYDYINRNETAQNRKALTDIQSNAALLGLDNRERGQMTDEEIGIFNYVYATQGKDAAYAYIDHLTRDLNVRQRAADEAQWAEWAKEKPVAMSALSVAMSPLKGVSYIGQAADLMGDGKIDQNAGYNKFSYLNSAVRNQVSEDIKGSIKSEFWGNAGSFGYQTAMSMADFLNTTLVSGGNSALAMTIMGSGAAADTVIDAKDRGLSDGQAFALGTIAGAAEAVTEKFSLDTLLDKTSLGKSTVGYIFKNVLAEGSEEGASTLINTMADVLISKDKSQWQMAIDAHKANGKTDGQAFGLALGEQALALGVDVLGGALSGGVMAGGNVAINKVGGVVQGRVPQVQSKAQTLQEAVQQQVAQKAGIHAKIQEGSVELAQPTVQYTQQMWDQSSRLAKLTGRNIRLYEDKESVNGSYDPDTGLIWVNTKGNDVFAQVFSHEMTHSLEEAGLYEKLSTVVLNRMQDTGINLDNAREAKRQQYARQGHALQNDAAVDQELVAEYVSRYLLTDEQSITDLVQKNRTLGQRIVGWFDGLLAKMGNKNAQERVFLSRARSLYIKALRQTQGVGAAQAQQARQQTATSAPMGEQVDVKAEARDETAGTDDDVEANMEAFRAAYIRGEVDEATYDQVMDSYEQWKNDQLTAGERKYSFKGYASDGKGIYESNFPKGTPKKAKGERILKYIQDVWSKKPITLRISDGGTTRFIEAQFDPTYSEDKNVRTDASKLMGGNRHGNATEQRVTLDLADDYYQIASESEYNYSKDETGKDSDPHQGVKQWHYFVNDIYFAEQGSETLTPYRVSINVKEKSNGHYFYNFSAEKAEGTSTPRTLHAAVNDSEGATANGNSSVFSIHTNDGKVNKKFSLSEDTVSKKDVARELQAILQRGGDVSELKRYVAQLEGSGGKAEQSGRSAEQKQGEAEQILEKAKRRGVSVEQYLQENAEQYESDGRWNADARKALDLEKSGGMRREVQYSLANDSRMMDAAIRKNQEDGKVRGSVLEKAAESRAAIADRMNEIKDRGLVSLPEDIEGNTYIANSSYDGTEENTTICPRSLASEAFVDAVSEYLGRPLSYEEQIYISQDLQGRSLTPECTYCYVATDRKAYRAFLGEYIKQRDAVVKKVKANPKTDVSRSGALYKEFLNGRKDTEPMYKRFKMWVDVYKSGTPMVEASHLANINKLMGDINSEFGADLKPQITDAMKYAQSASWAKKRISYVAYDGHILKWKQDRINKLNSHYGLRMYSFSDFHPAFVLENMQMITDASVRGLKMLGYTKDTDFVEIFAPSGMNINVSTFGFEVGGNVYENNIIGAEWAKAQELREQYPNVGVTFVATNDNLVEWALKQDWIDVVIPFHLVRTGTEVAKAFGYTDYTRESADTKASGWTKGDKKNIAPTDHDNDKATYLSALEKNHLNPRFARFKDNPNYMKLVNECRQSASQSKPVQPIFNEEAAMRALAKLEANGYYQPIGGSVERMYEIAAEVAESLDHRKSGVKYSLNDNATKEGTEKAPDLRSSMPKKAKAILDAAERTMQREVTSALHVPSLVAEAYLTPVVQELSDIYLDKGTLTEEDVGLLFDKFYANGVVACKDYLEKYSQVAERLHGTTLTPTAEEQRHVFDYKGLKEAARGKIRIVSTGGMTIAEAYQMARSMQPDLFPDDIETAHSQAWRLVYAVQNAELASNRMEQVKSDSEAKFREKEKADFNSAVSSIRGKLWEVKRFAEDKVAREKEAAPATAEEANTAYQELKKAKRALDRAKAKNLLTEQDEMQVGRLLRHEIELEHLDPEKDNVKGIAAVFEAKQEFERLCKLIAEYKQHLRGEAKKRADSFLQTANDWKDKKMGIAYSRETMERNIFDIIKDKALAQRIIDQYFTPVHKAEAAAARFKNDYRDRVRALQLSRKVQTGNLVSEAHAVQLLGEAEDNVRMLENARGRIKNRDGKNLSEWRAVVDKLWAENPNLDKGKIEKAVKEFRYIYDALFQKMNQVRVANGYEPVNYRNGYFPHFQPGDSDSILAQFGRALGIDTRIDALPTTINGLTHTFKPGIQWMGNAQERIGFNTAYDAVEGFDKYIEGVAGVIYQTQNIQNLRALASQIRYRTSNDGIREQVDAIHERPGLSEEEKQHLIQEVYARGRFTLSNFVTELDEYTNLLANKKSRYDRSIEAAMGRKAYTFLKAWEARVGANMIAGNLTSALTNFIPLTQAGAQMDRFALLQGMLSTLRAYRSDDGIVNQSTFLTNRRGSDPLVQTWAQKASDKLGKPMEWIDGFVADSIVRGAYLQNLKKGMSEAEAMNQADAFASSVMADRSKGAMPTLMQATNPLFKAFTQFQLEVNNQFSEVFKDIPRRFKEKGLATLAWVLLKYFLGAWLYNELYEELIGRRPALDPIGMLCQAYDDLQNDGFGEALISFGNSALEQLPFSAGLTIVGVEIEGGRIPATSAVPNFPDALQAIFSKNMSPEKRWKEVQDELNKLAYVVPPFGGNQVSKAVKGVKAYIQGGSYNVDADGNDILQYPVYKDEPKDAFWSLVQAAFLGKSSLDPAQDWVDSGFDGLNAKQTVTYQALLELGAADRAAFDAVTQLKNAGSKAMDKLQVISGLALTDDEKAVLVGSVLGTELLTESGGPTQYAKFDYAIQNGMGVDQYITYRASGADMDKYLELRDAGASVEDAMNAGMALAELKGSTPDHTAIQAWRTVIDAIEDPERQLMALSAVMTESQYNKALTAKGFGVAPELYVQANELLRKYDADGNGRYTQGEVTKALGAMKCSSSQKAALWQLITGSSSAKSNPYNAAVGQRVIDALNKAKSQEEETGLSFQDEIMRQIMGG